MPEGEFFPADILLPIPIYVYFPYFMSMFDGSDIWCFSGAPCRRASATSKLVHCLCSISFPPSAISKFSLLLCLHPACRLLTYSSYIHFSPALCRSHYSLTSANLDGYIDAPSLTARPVFSLSAIQRDEPEAQEGSGSDRCSE